MQRCLKDNMNWLITTCTAHISRKITPLQQIWPFRGAIKLCIRGTAPTHVSMRWVSSTYRGAHTLVVLEMCFDDASGSCGEHNSENSQ